MRDFSQDSNCIPDHYAILLHWALTQFILQLHEGGTTLHYKSYTYRWPSPSFLINSFKILSCLGPIETDLKMDLAHRPNINKQRSKIISDGGKCPKEGKTRKGVDSERKKGWPYQLEGSEGASFGMAGS